VTVKASLGAPAEPRQVRSKRRHPEVSVAQVFARDLRLEPGAPLVFLAPGQADSLRPDARAGHLICPLGDCRDNRFIVYGGTERRHHFKHRGGAGHHAPESIAHHTAKHLIARWLRRLYPTSQVFPDTQEVETGQRPDVLLVREDGSRVAYEVQFASLTAATWQERRDRYATEDIKNVWLFGGKHYDRHVSVSEGAAEQVQMHPIFGAVLGAVHPMLLIDPFAETVGLGTGHDVEALLVAAGVEPPDLWSPLATVSQRLALVDLPATGGVIDVPGVREQIRHARSRHAGWLDDLRRAAEQTARVEAQRQDRLAAIEAERARRLAAKQETERLKGIRREQLAREQAKSDAATARASQAQQQRVNILSVELQERKDRWRPERERIERSIGPLPAVVDSPSPAAETTTTTAAPDEWRWAVLRALAVNHGFAVDTRGLTDFMPLRAAARRSDAERLLYDYLNCLRAAGWVWFWGAQGPRAAEAVHVIAGPGMTPKATKKSALRMVGVRIAGPGPSGLEYLSKDGTPTMRTIDQARQVGLSTFPEVWAEAHVTGEARAILASLTAPDPTAYISADHPKPQAPDLSAVHRALPHARQWCDARAWPAWTHLSPRLHEATKLTLYVLLTLHAGQGQAGVRLGTCTDEDEHNIFEALRASGYVTKGATGWQPTFGGRL
jgi:hypothetical protein